MQLWSERAASLRPEVAERVRVLRDAPADDRGEFVLSWMHHAVRGHENPALDAAVEIGNALGKPVLVYQGLGGRHRFNSDRHHAFILHGARDAAAQLAQIGVRHVMHVPEDVTAPSPLRDLASRAALVVCEEFPAPPFPRWTSALADRCGRPVWCVDAACVVPMRLVPDRHDRAFKFRNKTAKLFRQRAEREWANAEPAASLRGAADGIDPGFEPVDLASADIAALCARCGIDHTLAPVAHTPGGSRAGYERWEAFKREGLARYDARRNNAAMPREALAVSRLSPYLHHGHVSPLKIARDALAIGGDGADKFIDELWVWRELAHNFCFHASLEDPDGVESVAILPDWARATLARHADDPRRLLSWETLARGRTGDELWDLCQTSLVRHGELHNNVRMTWGKAVAGWSAGASQALARLIDLNHRFALDGNNPNSYGGLLWCLGAFDRPFEPERPILGCVRPRDTATHAGRLDMGRYAAVAGGSSAMDGEAKRIGIIGGGMAGVACARALGDAGHEVRVFDKGRGPGGRMSRRRAETAAGEREFDHGAQYFTVRDDRFRRLVESWLADGIVASWDASLVAIEEEGIVPRPNRPTRYVGVPGMNRVVEHLAATLPEGCSVRFGVRVGAVHRHDLAWELEADDGEHLGSFDALVLALPPSQAAALLADVPDLRAQVSGVEMLPSWALMTAFESPLPVDYDAAFVNTGGVLSWIARNDSKPARPGAACWVAHGGPEWSAANIELDADAARDALLDGFFAALEIDRVEPSFAAAHRWRFALPASPLCVGCLADEELAVAVCGDWCQGARVEGAYLSGSAAAGRLLGLWHTGAPAAPARV